MISDRMSKEIKRSHTMISYVDVVTPSQNTYRLIAIEGNVDVDRTANIRRRCTVRCIDPEGVMTPFGPQSDLTPFGTEIRPYRGVVYADGTEEVLPLGVFHISDSNVTDPGDSALEIYIEAYDRSRKIIRDKFVEPYVIAAGTNVIAAIKAIIERTYPEAVYDSISTTVTFSAPKIYDVMDDPWEVVTELALSVGCSIYFDVQGKVVIAPDVDATDNPVFEYVEGQDCTMLSLERNFSDDPGYNGVVVTAESAGDDSPPVRVVVWDDDPTSPTYHFGPYGEVPMEHQDRTVTTEAEAEVVGKQILQTLLGSVASISAEAIVHPGLEAGHVVKVVRARSGVSGEYTVEAFNVPLNSTGTQHLTLREKRSV